MPGLYMWAFDPTYLIFVIPALIISIIAQAGVHSAYRKYSSVRNMRGMTGAEAAQRVLQFYGVTGVSVERVGGNLTDHFDPKHHVIRLSEGVYDSATIAAVGIAAHEAGHAAQYAKGYVPIKIRNAIYPIANIGSTLSFYIVLLGILFSYGFLINIGIILFSCAVLFQIITLPVEFNASSNAVRAIDEAGLLTEEELTGSKKVLRAAAMTYVAAAVASLLSLLRLLAIARRNNRG